MSNAAFTLKMSVEASPFYRYMDDFDARTGTKVLKQILKDVGTKVLVPALRNHAVAYAQYKYSKPTRNLRSSFGNITSTKKRNLAWVFVGPRMESGHQRRAGYRGWVANILENVKAGSHIKRKTDFKQVHMSRQMRVQQEIFRSVERVLRRRWK